MATAEQQLLGMMSPQQARLLDQQLAEKQIQTQAGNGLFSGAVASTLRGNQALGQAITGQRPVGINEQALMDKKKKLEALQKQEEQFNTEIGSALASTDITKLTDIRDKMIAKNTTKSLAAAQKIDEKITSIKEALADEKISVEKYKTRMDTIREEGIDAKRAETAAKYYSDSEFETFINRERKEVDKRNTENYISGLIGSGKYSTSATSKAKAFAKIGDYNKAMDALIKDEASPLTPQTRLFIMDNFENADKIIEARDNGKKYQGEWVRKENVNEEGNPVPLTNVSDEQRDLIDTILTSELNKADSKTLREKAMKRGVEIDEAWFTWFSSDITATIPKEQIIQIYNKYRSEFRNDKTYTLTDALIDTIDPKQKVGKYEIISVN
jgi:hypothetical protein